MKIIIFGVGRSGTTAVYVLLQKILEDAFPGDVDFVYEPFVWDRESFNYPYEEVPDKFDKIDSLSIDGLYHHQKLPLFVTDSSPLLPNAFVTDLLSPRGGKSNLLLKAIRACGRFPLFFDTDPGCRFIFVLRNPIDVVNSVLPLFSFYGGEFHRDDFQRFIFETNREFKQIFTIDSFESEAHKQAAWWYYMNAFALESVSKVKPRPLILTHERFVSDQENCIKHICTHLGLIFKDEYLGFAKQKVGWVSKCRFLSPEDLDLLRGIDKDYRTLLARYDVVCMDYEQNLLSRYNGSDWTTVQYTGYGLHANALAQQVKAQNIQIEQLELKLAEIHQKSVELHRQRDELQRRFDAIRSTRAYKLYSAVVKPFSSLESTRKST